MNNVILLSVVYNLEFISSINLAFLTIQRVFEMTKDGRKVLLVELNNTLYHNSTFYSETDCVISQYYNEILVLSI